MSQLPSSSPEYTQLPLTDLGQPPQTIPVHPPPQDSFSQDFHGYPQGYPQGHPAQEFSPSGYPPQAYPPQAYPQAYPPPGYPPQGYPPQGYPPQGYSPQGYPPQGYSLQAHPIGQPHQEFSAQPQPTNDGTSILADEDPKTALVEPEDFVQRWTASDYEIGWPTIKKWYNEAWQVFKMEWGAFLILTLCGVLLSLIPDIGFIFSMIADISFKVYGLHVIRHRETKGEPFYSSKTYISGFYYFIPVLIMLILWGIAIFVGLIFLILPGLFLMFVCLFSEPLLLEYYDEQISFENVFRMSVKVASKHFWWMLAFQLLTILLAISGLLFLGVGVFVTIPLARLSVLVAFKDLYGLNPHRRPDGTFYLLCAKIR